MLAANGGEPARVRRAAGLRPAHHVGDGALGPVAVEDDQRESVGRDRLLHPRQRLRRLPGQDAGRCLVAGEPAADEIVGAGVAHVVADRRIDVGEADEAVGKVLGRGAPGGGEQAGEGRSRLARMREVLVILSPTRVARFCFCTRNGRCYYSTKTRTLAARPAASMTVSVDWPAPSGCQVAVRRRSMFRRAACRWRASGTARGLPAV